MISPHMGSALVFFALLYLLEENEKVHALANALHWNDYTYKTSSGDHDWRAWDAQIRSVLEWMHAHLQAE